MHSPSHQDLFGQPQFHCLVCDQCHRTSHALGASVSRLQCQNHDFSTHWSMHRTIRCCKLIFTCCAVNQHETAHVSLRIRVCILDTRIQVDSNLRMCPGTILHGCTGSQFRTPHKKVHLHPTILLVSWSNTTDNHKYKMHRTEVKKNVRMHAVATHVLAILGEVKCLLNSCVTTSDDCQFFLFECRGGTCRSRYGKKLGDVAHRSVTC